MKRLSTKQKIFAYTYITIIVIIVLVILGIIILQIIKIGYTKKWTGFEEKTLWDWMDLLIIPLVLAFGVFFLNRSEKNTEREIAKNKQQEEMLQTYIDRMSELLLKEKILTGEEDNFKEARNVANIRTLTALRVLDRNRKALLIKFLYDAELIKGDNPIIDLRGSNLTNANFTLAELKGVNLREVRMWDAVLRDAKLAGANLQGSYLWRVNMKDADLTNVDLSNADLSGAKVTKKQLDTVRSLKGTTMPDGTVHE